MKKFNILLIASLGVLVFVAPMTYGAPNVPTSVTKCLGSALSWCAHNAKNLTAGAAVVVAVSYGAYHFWQQFNAQYVEVSRAGSSHAVIRPATAQEIAQKESDIACQTSFLRHLPEQIARGKGQATAETVLNQLLAATELAKLYCGETETLATAQHKIMELKSQCALTPQPVETLVGMASVCNPLLQASKDPLLLQDKPIATMLRAAYDAAYAIVRYAIEHNPHRLYGPDAHYRVYGPDAHYQDQKQALDALSALEHQKADLRSHLLGSLRQLRGVLTKNYDEQALRTHTASLVHEIEHCKNEAVGFWVAPTMLQRMLENITLYDAQACAAVMPADQQTARTHELQEVAALIALLEVQKYL